MTYNNDVEKEVDFKLLNYWWATTATHKYRLKYYRDNLVYHHKTDNL